MQIVAPRSDDDLRRYVAFADEVYRDTPAWVPPDAHHLVERIGSISGGRS
jgi:hypothetical protein